MKLMDALGVYHVELLSPMGIPGGQATIVATEEVVTGTYLESGKSQVMQNLSETVTGIKWTVSIGEQGNEQFVFDLTAYGNGLFMGGADAGRGPSPVIARVQDCVYDIQPLYVTVPSGPSGDKPDGMPPIGGPGGPGGMPPMDAHVGMPPVGAEQFELDGAYLLLQLDTKVYHLATFVSQNGKISGSMDEKALTEISCDGISCAWKSGLQSYQFDMYHQNVLVGNVDGHPVAGRRIDQEEALTFRARLL